VIKRVFVATVVVLFILTWFLFGTTVGTYVVDELRGDASPLPDGLKTALGVVSWIFVGILFVFRRFFWHVLFMFPGSDSDDQVSREPDRPGVFRYRPPRKRRPELFKDGEYGTYDQVVELWRWIDECEEELKPAWQRDIERRWAEMKKQQSGE